MFVYLETHDGPVVSGAEEFEKVYAKNQPEYIPLRTLPGERGASAISRWRFTDEQRKAIANGADILLEVVHFHGPLAPVRMMLSDRLDAGGHFPRWFAVQTQGPYFEKLAQAELQTINVSYSCALCGLKKVSCRVPARGSETVTEWMGVTVQLLAADHQKRSPGCRAEKLDELMIPITGAECVGGPAVQ
jgi:hypothetical protein